MKRVTDKKGYITLETAIFLPIFILAIVSLMYYINILSIQENVYYSAIEETSRQASKASVVKIAPQFKSVTRKRILMENPAIEDLEIGRFRYLYWDGDLDNLIAVDMSANVDLALPLNFGHEYPISVHVKCRGFTGIKSKDEIMSFEEMESAGVWEPVWIFPTNGEKYHCETCTYVKANAKEMVLTNELKRKYEPCSLCDAESVSVGAYVYCFTENGTVYHRDTCRQVDRYALEINKEEAIGKGFEPCNKCGGG